MDCYEVSLKKVDMLLTMRTMEQMDLPWDCAKIKEARRRIGSTVQKPALYPQFTAYCNLELQRVLVGNPDKSVCGELLKLVDLYDVRDKKVKEFSMGMKQRMSIALALVGKPELLILDEPVNGLDPKNISALRMLLKN